MTRLINPRQLFAVSALLVLQGCYYSAPRFEATIVDAENNQPLQGVIVVAHWQASGGLEGLNPVGEVMIMEDVTNKDGRIYFPGWSKFSTQDIKWDRPQLLLFKNGYKHLRLINDEYPRGVFIFRNPVLESEWNGKTIKLEKFKGSLQEYAEELWNLDFSMEFARWGHGCEWKRTPRMITALHQMSLYFDAQGVKASGRIEKISDFGDDQRERCGSPEAFFSSYLNQDYTK